MLKLFFFAMCVCACFVQWFLFIYIRFITNQNKHVMKTTNKIEKALKEQTKKDLKRLAKDINNLIERFASEKGINYNYMYFENEDRVLEKLSKYETIIDPSGRAYYDFYYLSNSKYENSLGDVEKAFYNMLSESFFESLQERKVENLINKVNLLEE